MLIPPHPPPTVILEVDGEQAVITMDRAASPYYPHSIDKQVHVVWQQNCPDCTNFAGQMAGVIVSANHRAVLNGPMTLEPGIHFYSNQQDVEIAIAFAAALKVILGYDTKVSIDPALRSPVLAIGSGNP